MLTYLSAHLTGKLVVDGVARTRGNDASLDGLSDKSHVTDDVEQFVARTLILPHKGLVLYVTEFGGIHVRYLQEVCKLVKTLLCGLFLVYYYGIVEVATLYKVGLEQRLYVAHEHERACRRYLLCEVINLVECGKLAVHELGVERAHGSKAELLIRKNSYARASSLILDLYLVTNDVPVLRSIELLYAYFLDFIDIKGCASIKNRELGAVDLYQAVVYTHSIKGRQAMLNRRHAHVALAEHSATLCVDDILSHSLYDGHTVQVYSLYFISMILRGRIERHREAQTCVKSFAAKRETTL